MPMPNLVDKASLFAGATAWCTLGMLQCYWKVPLSEDAQEKSTMVTPEGLFTAPCSAGGGERYRIFPGDDG